MKLHPEETPLEDASLQAWTKPAAASSRQHPALPPKGSGLNPSHNLILIYYLIPAFLPGQKNRTDSIGEHKVFPLGVETNDAAVEVPSLLHKATCQKEPHKLTQ